MNFGDYMVAGRAGISEEVCVILNQFSQLKIKACPASSRRQNNAANKTAKPALSELLICRL